MKTTKAGHVSREEFMPGNQGSRGWERNRFVVEDPL